MKKRVKHFLVSRLGDQSLAYNAMAWTYGLVAGQPSVRRQAAMRARKDSRFAEDELDFASLCPTGILDLVLAELKPRSVLDVGCGVGLAVQYLADHGVDCRGIEGSEAAIAKSPVQPLISLANLNRPVRLGRRFDVVWSFEVAEHIHSRYTNVFLDTVTAHGDTVVLSAAHPGQGGLGHFNEQPQAYWVDRLALRGFTLNPAVTTRIQALPDQHACNVMVFERRS